MAMYWNCEKKIKGIKTPTIMANDSIADLLLIDETSARRKHISDHAHHDRTPVQTTQPLTETYCIRGRYANIRGTDDAGLNSGSLSRRFTCAEQCSGPVRWAGCFVPPGGSSAGTRPQHAARAGWHQGASQRLVQNDERPAFRPRHRQGAMGASIAM